MMAAQLCSISTSLNLIVVCTVVLCWWPHDGGVSGLPDDPTVTYESLYTWGKQAYTAGNWDDCLRFVRRSLEDYRYFRGELLGCRRECATELPEISPMMGTLSEMQIFDYFIKKSLCQVRCRHQRFGHRPDGQLDDGIEEDFDTYKPYSYLQLCYWKLNNLPRAVSAAYTFLLRNPTDTMMRENLQFYSSQSDYKAEMAKDLEQKQYQEDYINGINAYDDEDYMGTIDHLEKSLEHYFIEEQNCRILCEGTVGWDPLEISPEYYSIVAAQYAHQLDCRKKCEQKLQMINGDRIDDLVPRHFNYLQYAYWKVDRRRDACKAVAHYLLFVPNDDDMMHNRNFYAQAIELGQEELFQPSKKILNYYRRTKLEERVLGFYQKKFNFTADHYPPVEYDDYYRLSEYLEEMEPYSDRPSIAITTQESPETKDTRPSDTTEPQQTGERPSDDDEMAGVFRLQSDALNHLRFRTGVTVTRTEAELNGGKRFLAEHILNSNECNALMSLRKQGIDTIHGTTKLTLNEIIEVVKRNSLDVELGRLVLDKNELVKEVLQTYFGVQILHYKSVHLVCHGGSTKSAIGSSDDVKCEAMHNGDCSNDIRTSKRSDQFATYAAFVSLDGGKLSLMNGPKAEQVKVEVKCGNVVAFQSTDKTYYNDSDTGCTLEMWFDSDDSSIDEERVAAQQNLAEYELLLHDTDNM